MIPNVDPKYSENNQSSLSIIDRLRIKYHQAASNKDIQAANAALLEIAKHIKENKIDYKHDKGLNEDVVLKDRVNAVIELQKWEHSGTYGRSRIREAKLFKFLNEDLINTVIKDREQRMAISIYRTNELDELGKPEKSSPEISKPIKRVQLPTKPQQTIVQQSKRVPPLSSKSVPSVHQPKALSSYRASPLSKTATSTPNQSVSPTEAPPSPKKAYPTQPLPSPPSNRSNVSTNQLPPTSKKSNATPIQAPPPPPISKSNVSTAQPPPPTVRSSQPPPPPPTSKKSNATPIQPPPPPPTNAGGSQQLNRPSRPPPPPPTKASAPQKKTVSFDVNQFTDNHYAEFRGGHSQDKQAGLAPEKSAEPFDVNQFTDSNYAEFRGGKSQDKQAELAPVKRPPEDLRRPYIPPVSSYLPAVLRDKLRSIHPELHKNKWEETRINIKDVDDFILTNVKVIMTIALEQKKAEKLLNKLKVEIPGKWQMAPCEGPPGYYRVYIERDALAQHPPANLFSPIQLRDKLKTVVPELQWQSTALKAKEGNTYTNVIMTKALDEKAAIQLKDKLKEEIPGKWRMTPSKTPPGFYNVYIERNELAYMAPPKLPERPKSTDSSTDVGNKTTKKTGQSDSSTKMKATSGKITDSHIAPTAPKEIIQTTPPRAKSVSKGVSFDDGVFKTDIVSRDVKSKSLGRSKSTTDVVNKETPSREIKTKSKSLSDVGRDLKSSSSERSMSIPNLERTTSVSSLDQASIDLHLEFLNVSWKEGDDTGPLEDAIIQHVGTSHFEIILSQAGTDFNKFSIIMGAALDKIPHVGELQMTNNIIKNILYKLSNIRYENELWLDNQEQRLLTILAKNNFKTSKDLWSKNKDILKEFIDNAKSRGIRADEVGKIFINVITKLLGNYSSRSLTIKQKAAEIAVELIDMFSAEQESDKENLVSKITIQKFQTKENDSEIARQILQHNADVFLQIEDKMRGGLSASEIEKLLVKTLTKKLKSISSELSKRAASISKQLLEILHTEKKLIAETMVSKLTIPSMLFDDSSLTKDYSGIAAHIMSHNIALFWEIEHEMIGLVSPSELEETLTQALAENLKSEFPELSKNAKAISTELLKIFPYSRHTDDSSFWFKIGAYENGDYTDKANQMLNEKLEDNLKLNGEQSFANNHIRNKSTDELVKIKPQGLLEIWKKEIVKKLEQFDYYGPQPNVEVAADIIRIQVDKEIESLKKAATYQDKQKLEYLKQLKFYAMIQGRSSSYESWISYVTEYFESPSYLGDKGDELLAKPEFRKFSLKEKRVEDTTAPDNKGAWESDLDRLESHLIRHEYYLKKTEQPGITRFSKTMLAKRVFHTLARAENKSEAFIDFNVVPAVTAYVAVGAKQKPTKIDAKSNNTQLESGRLTTQEHHLRTLESFIETHEYLLLYSEDAPKFLSEKAFEIKKASGISTPVLRRDQLFDEGHYHIYKGDFEFLQGQDKAKILLEQEEYLKAISDLKDHPEFLTTRAGILLKLIDDLQKTGITERIDSGETSIIGQIGVILKSLEARIEKSTDDNEFGSKLLQLIEKLKIIPGQNALEKFKKEGVDLSKKPREWYSDDLKEIREIFSELIEMCL